MTFLIELHDGGWSDSQTATVVRAEDNSGHTMDRLSTLLCYTEDLIEDTEPALQPVCG